MLKTLAIDYDLDAPLQSYDRIADAIKCNSWLWAHPLKSHWLVQVPMTADQLKNLLLPCLDAGDKLAVSEVGSDRASHNVEFCWHPGGRHPSQARRAGAYGLTGLRPNPNALGLTGFGLAALDPAPLSLNALAPRPPTSPVVNALAEMLLGDAQPSGKLRPLGLLSEGLLSEYPPKK